MAVPRRRPRPDGDSVPAPDCPAAEAICARRRSPPLWRKRSRNGSADAEPAPRCNTIDLPIQQTLTGRRARPWRSSPWRVGEALDTYIICRMKNENLWLIDKHAAHERLRFNALKERQEPPMRQVLLQPLTVDLEADAYAAALSKPGPFWRSLASPARISAPARCWCAKFRRISARRTPPPP